MAYNVGYFLQMDGIFVKCEKLLKAHRSGEDIFSLEYQPKVLQNRTKTDVFLVRGIIIHETLVFLQLFFPLSMLFSHILFMYNFCFSDEELDINSRIRSKQNASMQKVKAVDEMGIDEIDIVGYRMREAYFTKFAVSRLMYIIYCPFIFLRDFQFSCPIPCRPNKPTTLFLGDNRELFSSYEALHAHRKQSAKSGGFCDSEPYICLLEYEAVSFVMRRFFW
jgi:hypothetical protein